MRAVIFDMDGVIVDTMDLHFESSQRVFEEHGLKFPLAELKKAEARRSQDGFRALLPDKSDSEIDKMVKKKYDYLLAKAGSIKPINGFFDFFFLVRGAYPIGLFSSSNREFVDRVLNDLGIRRDFSVVVCGDDVKASKPDPEGYLRAAKKLRVKPSECIVVEDSLHGLNSARQAGMKVIAVTNTYDREFLQDADLVVDSLAEVSAEKLEGLFNA